MLHGKMFNPNLRGIFPRLLYKFTTIIHYEIWADTPPIYLKMEWASTNHGRLYLKIR